jgi:hypothetical protein
MFRGYKANLEEQRESVRTGARAQPRGAMGRLKSHFAADEFEAVVCADASALQVETEGGLADGAHRRRVRNFRARRSYMIGDWANCITARDESPERRQRY